MNFSRSPSELLIVHENFSASRFLIVWYSYFKILVPYDSISTSTPFEIPKYIFNASIIISNCERMIPSSIQKTQ